MKKIVLAIIFLFTLSVSAQDAKKWTVGVGVNFIDNSNSQNGNYFNVSNWNSTLSVSKLSAQYEFYKNFSASSEFTFNRLEKDKDQNGGVIENNLSYFGWDFNGRYNTAGLFKLPSKYVIEPVVGVGLSWTDGISNQSLNAGLAFGYFFNDVYGVRLQTLGKFASETETTVGNNMIQHSIELIFKL